MGKYRIYQPARHYQRTDTILLGVILVLVSGFAFTHFLHIADAQGDIVKQLAESDSVQHQKAINKASKTGSAHAPKNTPSTAPVTAQSPLSTVTLASCASSAPAQPGLAGSSEPTLQSLLPYQTLCGGDVFKRTSFFTNTPGSVAEARDQASDLAGTLKEYARFGISPVVFLEPTDGSGNNIDLSQFAAGGYETALRSLFDGLKTSGITDATMGTWVIIPEGNLPIWSTSDPGTFAGAVTRAAQLQKSYFPGSSTSIMLDSSSYAPGTSWGQGHAVSLLPYVQSIPAGLINSFGLQGFPWASPANQAGGVKAYDPRVYLRADFAAEAASKLGTSAIWFNTGTFARMYTNNAKQTVAASATERQTMLSGVVSQAKALQVQHYSVAIHLFAEDKSTTSEAIDWSYPSASDKSIFQTFVHDARVANIPLWLFDSTDH